MNISFYLQNPDTTPPNQSIIYLAQENTLHFVFSGNIPVLQTTDTLTIKIPNTLLASAGASNMTDPGWKVQSFTAPDGSNIYFTFVLAPSSQIPTGTTLSVSFAKLKPARATSDTVVANFLIGGRPLPGTRAVLSSMAAPGGGLNLNTAITFQAFFNQGNAFGVPSGQIYGSVVAASDSNTIAMPIANTIHINLKYNGNAPLTPNWPAAVPPKFQFYFSYGNNSIDLTDAQQSTDPNYNPLTTAWKIIAALPSDGSENAQWNLPTPTPQAGAGMPLWEVDPTQTNQNLFSPAGPNLDVYFRHVISILPAGNATLYIQWSNIPGYSDGIKAVDVPRAAPPGPQVIEFSGPGRQKSVTLPALSTPLELDWTVFGATTVRLYFPDGNTYSEPFPVTFDPRNPQLCASGSINGAIVPVLPSSGFRLTAFNPQGNPSAQSDLVTVVVSDFEAPKISAFNGNIQYNEGANQFSAILSWEIQNAVYDTVAAIQGDPNTYSYRTQKSVTYTLSAQKPLQKPYTLQATDTLKGLSDKQSIAVSIPEQYQPNVLSFNGKISRNPNTGQASLEFDFETSNLYEGGYVLLNGQTNIPHAGGKGSYTLPLSADNPLVYQYELTAVNHLLGEQSKVARLTVTFADTPTEAIKLGYPPLQLLLTKNGSNALVLVQDGSNGDLRLAHFNTALLPSGQSLTSYSFGNIMSDLNMGGFGFGMSISDDNRIFIGGITGSVWFVVFPPDQLDSPAVTTYTPQGAFWADGVRFATPVIQNVAWLLSNNGLTPYNLKTNTMTTQAISGFFWNFELVSLVNTIVGPDGKTVFMADVQGNLGWFDATHPPAIFAAKLSTGLGAPDIYNTHSDSTYVKKIALPKSGNVYMTGLNADFSVLYFNIANPSVITRTGPGNTNIRNITLSDDEEFVVLLDVNGNMTVRPGFTTQYPPAVINTGLSTGVIDVAFSPDHTRIFALTNNDNAIHILEPQLVKTA